MLLPKVTSVLRKKGYRLNTRPYELNIVGIRSSSAAANRFDDEIHAFCMTDKHNWEYHVFKATTDPGTYWLKNPTAPQGTAILAQGQYINAYRIGLHQGKYKALVQAGLVTVIRDYDRDAYLDFLNGTRYTGLYGINIHRAMVEGTTRYVDRYSAGCQVFADAAEFNAFLSLCDRHSRLYGNRFTYTLIDYRAIHRENLRRVAITGIALSLIGTFTYLLIAPQYE